MSIKSWIKGKLKQREMRKLEPEKDFEFEEDYYGNSNIIEGFNFVYCNNYTDKLYSEYNEELQFISCIISLPADLKVLRDLAIFMNNIVDIKSFFKYKNVWINLGTKKVQVFLRGDLLFYDTICRKIHNNIFAKYIRNNLFYNEVFVQTPNEYLENNYNSINNPYKDIDILFIENNVLCKEFSPVIGLSISKKYLNNSKNILPPMNVIYNNRYIIYLQLDQLNDNELSYLIENVKHGDKLIDLIHKHNTDNDYLDIDEVIEE